MGPLGTIQRLLQPHQRAVLETGARKITNEGCSHVADFWPLFFWPLFFWLRSLPRLLWSEPQPSLSLPLADLESRSRGKLGCAILDLSTNKRAGQRHVQHLQVPRHRPHSQARRRKEGAA